MLNWTWTSAKVLGLHVKICFSLMFSPQLVNSVMPIFGRPPTACCRFFSFGLFELGPQPIWLQRNQKKKGNENKMWDVENYKLSWVLQELIEFLCAFVEHHYWSFLLGPSCPTLPTTKFVFFLLQTLLNLALLDPSHCVTSQKIDRRKLSYDRKRENNHGNFLSLVFCHSSVSCSRDLFTHNVFQRWHRK